MLGLVIIAIMLLIVFYMDQERIFHHPWAMEDLGLRDFLR